MHVSPTYAITRSTGDEFENKRTITTTYDLYEAFRTISRVPKEDIKYNSVARYINRLYEERENIIPAGTNLLPEYIEYKDIPNANDDYTKYNQFFKELKSSLKNTLKVFDKIPDEQGKTDDFPGIEVLVKDNKDEHEDISHEEI